LVVVLTNCGRESEIILTETRDQLLKASMVKESRWTSIWWPLDRTDMLKKMWNGSEAKRNAENLWEETI
jgi:hypothetical protein